MKRTMAILLALIMVFALAAPVMASGNGQITVNNAVVGQTYTISDLPAGTYTLRGKNDEIELKL